MTQTAIEFFRFCPRCGGQLHPPDEDGGCRCDHCDRSWYRNAAPTTGCVIARDGKALVTVRGSDPEKGKVDIPGGFLKIHEDPVAALKRELREELGVEIAVDMSDCVQAVPHAYGDDGDWTLAMGFRARLVSGEPTPNDDVASCRWVGASEVDGLDWAWDHDRSLVKKVLEDPEHG